MVEYIVGNFVYNYPYIKQIKYVEANDSLEALKEYAKKRFDPSCRTVFQCIGYYENNNTCLVKDYVCNIDWDLSLPILKFPIKWITQSEFDKREFRNMEDK